ncbi:MAG TPA: DedA family protein [Ktedonobacteraceae bacterium]|nr:DedA family protein [Ktedonobacteraceae bacterium]
MLELAFRLIHNTNPVLIYVIVGVILLLESTGIPIVNSTLLLLTGALASLGRLDIFALAFVSITGSIAGACIAYVIGWHGGARLLYHVAAKLHIDTRKIQALEKWFHKAGGRMIFLSRIVPYIRPFSCFPAGIAHMPFRRFFAAASSGSVIWCAGMLALGWSLGHRWRQALSLIQTYTVPTVLVIALLLVGYCLLRLAIKRRLDARLQAASDSVIDVGGQNDHDLLEV